MLRLRESDVEASLLRESYFDAFQAFWPHMSKEELQLNWHIRYICDELQDMLERVIAGKPKLHDLIINVPPGTSKSSMVSVGLHPWLWGRMPHAQIISGSHSRPLANELSLKSKDIIESEQYREMFPKVRLRKDQSLKTHYKNTLGGWRLATSVGSRIVGFHAHLILIDDPLNPLPEKAGSKLKFEAANDWIHQTLTSRVVDKDLVPTIMVMQRLHQLDPTGYWLEWKKDRKVKHICLPADKPNLAKPPEVRKYYKRGLLDPKRLAPKTLTNTRNALGTFTSAAQLDQSPIAAGGNMFDVTKLLANIVDRPPQIVKAVRFWDNASVDGGGDATAGPCLGEDVKGMYWILDLQHGHWGSDRREEIKLITAQSDGLDVEIGQEIEGGSSGRDSFLATARLLRGYRIRGFRAVGSKQLRADTFSRQVNIGNVGMVRGPWNAKVISELQYFPHGAHDDIVDGLSGCAMMLFRKRKKGRAL